MISTSPAVTTKNGTMGSPASIRTSPRAIERATPCVAMRAIWAGVSVGNMSASCEALTGGVDRTDSATPYTSATGLVAAVAARSASISRAAGTRAAIQPRMSAITTCLSTSFSRSWKCPS